jgi:hypothetical protein
MDVYLILQLHKLEEQPQNTTMFRFLLAGGGGAAWYHQPQPRRALTINRKDGEEKETHWK